jgi:hypothetical protein
MREAEPLIDPEESAIDKREAKPIATTRAQG